MAERLFGVETEYAVAGLDGGASMDRACLVKRILEEAKRSVIHLPDMQSSGIFLANGARFYTDRGSHPEFSTPECANPWDVVRYIRAGEEIITGILNRLGENGHPGSEIICFRANVDYHGATWGCHESFSHSASPETLSEQIIPHLVARIIYTGAGGWNPFSKNLDFTLSPRAAHIECVISNSSTEKRGIIHTKDESLSGPGYHRFHILCGESLCSEIATWLKVGATALVVAMVDAGLRPGSAVQLASPLKALRTVAADVECKALLPLADGGSRSAVAIQRHYLEQAEAHASDHFMPPWAGEVCRRWHAMLDLLEGAPESVETTLDWAMKLALYTDQVRCRGLRWRSLSGWNAVITRLNELVTRSGAQFLDVDFHIGPHNPMLEDVAAMTPWLRERGLRWGDLGAYTKLLAEMCEIDTRFGQLGDKGIFQSLDRAGLLTHHMPGVDNIEHAIHNPPAIGRARIRGEAVRRLAGQNGRAQCDWQFVWDKHLSRVLDLSDPFATEERWRDNGPDIDDTLRRIFALRR